MKARNGLFWIADRAFRMQFSRRKLYGEALFRLLGAWVLIHFVPYSLWRSKLGKIEEQTDFVPLTASQLTTAREIASAHQVLLVLFGTRFTCLMHALSARGMLRARGISSTLILGVNRKDSAGGTAKLGAHAWVKCETMDIVGHEGSETFIPVAVYN